MGKHRSKRKKNSELKRKMKITDRQDDIPDCPSITSLEIIDSDMPITDNKLLEEPSTAKETKKNEEQVKKSSPEYKSWFLPPDNVRSNIFNCQSDPKSSLEFQSEEAASEYLQSQYSYDSYSNQPLFNANKITPVVEAVGHTLLEAVVQGIQLVKIGVKYPVSDPLSPSALSSQVSTFSILYLEISVAATVDFVVGVTWPPLHIGLRNMERMLLSSAKWFREMDEMGQAIHCDMATSWCQRFGLMCDVQCSFTEFTLNRNR
ncbi:unnamed protein product [Bursaphelenchus okinawaensis]|uniref:Uncharacterized protein n=1 Tax=Bursaphelenchus okinawaensis TaxID=465554 RepID=A0A811K2M1_9BILA|nr:unnamed protein product [Bursaphelenchus okinawaensis]CAG9089873.1 unnamed protein product [Bursaphelenchus okinawaensis]